MSAVANAADLKALLEPILGELPGVRSVERYQVEDGLDDLRVTCDDGTVFELRCVTTSPER